MVQLLLDQGLPGSTASLLRETGIDAIHAAEIGLSTAEDTEILQKALKNTALLSSFASASLGSSFFF